MIDIESLLSSISDEDMAKIKDLALNLSGNDKEKPTETEKNNFPIDLNTMNKIMWAHDEAEKRGITNPISSSELLIELGEEVQIFIGDRDNIKVTTPEDMRFVRAYYYYRRYENFAREASLYGI